MHLPVKHVLGMKSVTAECSVDDSFAVIASPIVGDERVVQPA